MELQLPIMPLIGYTVTPAPKVPSFVKLDSSSEQHLQSTNSSTDLYSCIWTFNWNKIKNSSNSIKTFTQCTLHLRVNPGDPTSYRACSPHAPLATAAFKHVSDYNLNKHTSVDHTNSLKPPSLWPEGRVPWGPRSLAVDNQGHFVFGNIRAVTFSQGVPYP